MIWTSIEINKFLEVHFEFPFELIDQSNYAFLTGQSWQVLKSCHTARGPEQGFRSWLTDGLNQRFIVLPIVQATLLLTTTCASGLHQPMTSIYYLTKANTFINTMGLASDCIIMSLTYGWWVLIQSNVVNNAVIHLFVRDVMSHV